MHRKLDFEKTPTCLQDKPFNENHNQKEAYPSIAGGDPHGNNEAQTARNGKKNAQKQSAPLKLQCSIALSLQRRGLSQ